jgi:hypothetical protein
MALTFEDDIKPLFRARDRGAMLGVSHFDLWSESDVKEHIQPILGQLRAGKMPCDGPWPSDKIDLLQQWADQGSSS